MEYFLPHFFAYQFYYPEKYKALLYRKEKKYSTINGYPKSWVSEFGY